MDEINSNQEQDLSSNNKLREVNDFYSNNSNQEQKHKTRLEEISQLYNKNLSNNPTKNEPKFPVRLIFGFLAFLFILLFISGSISLAILRFLFIIAFTALILYIEKRVHNKLIFIMLILLFLTLFIPFLFSFSYLRFFSRYLYLY